MFKPSIGRYTFYHPVHGHLIGTDNDQPKWSQSEGDLRRKLSSFESNFYPSEQSPIMTRLQEFIMQSEQYDGLILRYEYPNSDEFVLMDPMPREYRKRLIAARRLDHLEDPFVFNGIPLGSRLHYYDFFEVLDRTNKGVWPNVMYAKRGDVIKRNHPFIMAHARSKTHDFARLPEDLFFEIFSDIEDPVQPIARVANLLMFSNRESMMLYRLGVTELDFVIIDMNTFFEQVDSDLDAIFKDTKLIHVPGIFLGKSQVILQVR